MIKMNDVVVNILRRGDDIAYQARVIRHFDIKSIFNCSYRSQSMHHSADRTDTLRPDPCFARVAIPHDQLNAPKHGTRAPSIRNLPVIYLRFDTQMTFDPGNRIHNDASHVASYECGAAGCAALFSESSESLFVFMRAALPIP